MMAYASMSAGQLYSLKLVSYYVISSKRHLKSVLLSNWKRGLLIFSLKWRNRAMDMIRLPLVNLKNILKDRTKG